MIIPHGLHHIYEKTMKTTEESEKYNVLDIFQTLHPRIDFFSQSAIQHISL